METKSLVTNCRYLKKKFRNKGSNDYNKQKKELEDNYIDTCIEHIFNLKTELMKISTSFAFLEEFLTNSIIYYTSTYNQMYYNYKELIKKSIKEHSKSHLKIWIRCLNTYKEVPLMEKQYLKIFDTLKKELNKNQGYRKTKAGDKYKRIFKLPLSANLPSSEIEYTNDFGRDYEIVSYTYEIKSLEDLLNISVYQLSLQKKLIIRCKNCNKYFIANRKNRIFCDKNCKSAFSRKRVIDSQNQAVQYYSKLSNKYRHSKIYEKSNIELKNLYKEYKAKNIDDTEFMNMLLNLDNKVQSTYNVKRGRPKKNDILQQKRVV